MMNENRILKPNLPLPNLPKKIKEMKKRKNEAYMKK